MYNVLDTFTPDQWKDIGTRLESARIKKGFSLGEVLTNIGEKHPKLDTQALQAVEKGTPLTPGLLIDLCRLYDTQMYIIMKGPLPYNTRDEWLTAYTRGDVTESQIAHGLEMSYIAVRRMMKELGIQEQTD